MPRSTTPRSPRSTPDLSRFFLRLDEKGPIIKCAYCGALIDAVPVRGVNIRRQTHLNKCERFKSYEDDFKDFRKIVLRCELKNNPTTNRSSSENEEEEDEEDKEEDEEEEEEKHLMSVGVPEDDLPDDREYPSPNEIDPLGEFKDSSDDVTMCVLLV